MALEGDKQRGDSKHDNQHPCKLVRQLYFAKIEGYCPDPDLEAKLNKAKELRKQLREKKSCLFQEMIPLKEKLDVLDPDYGLRRWDRRMHWHKKDIQGKRELLFKHWPESINEDLEEESNPDVELAEILERIEKLTKQVGHGKTHWAGEKKSLKELEHLERRRQLLEPQVKLAQAVKPGPPRHYSAWCYGSKYDFKRRIQGDLKYVRRIDPYFWNEKKQAERKQEIVGLEKLLTPIEQRYNLVKQKEEGAVTSILELQNQIKDEIRLNYEYSKLQEKVQNLATKEDWVLLEELSCKQIEDFMSKWTRDHIFRANYSRSIQISLANRGLSSDGRMQDPLEII